MRALFKNFKEFLDEKWYGFIQFIGRKCKELNVFLGENIAETLLILGFITILYATFLVNFILFLYVLGVTLVILSIFVAKSSGK